MQRIHSLMPANAYCQQLPPNQQAQANDFYRRHGSAIKARQAHQVWIAGAPNIAACTCVQPVPGSEGHWLTSLFVDPALRCCGLAGRLLDHVRSNVEGPIWLFCRPELGGLYQRHGYQIAADLPQSLATKLSRYQHDKQLIAMVHLG